MFHVTPTDSIFIQFYKTFPGSFGTPLGFLDKPIQMLNLENVHLSADSPSSPWNQCIYDNSGRFLIPRLRWGKMPEYPIEDGSSVNV